jgi:predicted dinucleotide-utilizing enzyme
MWKKWILYGVTAVACIVLVQQVATTVYLAKIDYGLRSSLQSTHQLAEIQNSIIEKNNALNGLASTARQMNRQLGATLVVTEQIDVNIGAINHLNKATLDINQTLVSTGQHSHTNLTGVAQQLAKLNQSISAISQSIGGLDSILASDAAALNDMKLQTDRMNSKVPGVAR